MLLNLATLQNLFIKRQNTPQFQTFQEQFDANIFVKDNFPGLINSIQNTNLGFLKKNTNGHPQIFFYPIIFHHKLYNILNNTYLLYFILLKYKKII